MQPTPVFGKYRLLKRLAVGGMAEVFLAELVGAEGFARRVVIKRILPQYCEDPYFVELFINEASISAKLTHSNVVQVFDFDTVDGHYYIAMEFVQGADLARLLRKGARAGVLLPRVAALYIVGELLEALSYAHARTDDQGRPLGIVHRDVSPANVLISTTGEVKLSDFGIARAQTSVALTRPGVLKGKVPYMSPEQVDGAPLDGRSDLFSVGVILYELCTRSRPFRGDSEFQIMERIRKVDFRRPREIDPTLPARFEEVIVRALAREPDDRYQRAEDFLAAVQALGALEAGDLGPPAVRPFLEAVAGVADAEEEAPTHVGRQQGAPSRPSNPSGGAPPGALAPRERTERLAPDEAAVAVAAVAAAAAARSSAPKAGAASPPAAASRPDASVEWTPELGAAATVLPGGPGGPSAKAIADARRAAQEKLAAQPATAGARTASAPSGRPSRAAPAVSSKPGGAPAPAGQGAEGRRRTQSTAPVRRRDEQAAAARSGRGRSALAAAGILAVAFAVLGAGAWAFRRATHADFELTVAWRMVDEQEEWFRREVIAPFEHERGIKVRILRYDHIEDVEDLALREGVDLVKVGLPVTRALVERGAVQRIDTIFEDAGRARELKELLKRYREDALELARFPTLTARGLFYLPRKLEVRNLLVRTSKVKDAVAALPALRPQLEAELRRATGHGLPVGFELEPEPDRWDLYDVLAAAYVWARTPDSSGRVMPRLVHRSHRYWGTVDTFLDMLAGLAPPGPIDVHLDDALVDVFAWESIFRELDLYHPKMWAQDTVMSGRGLREAHLRDEVFLSTAHQLDDVLLCGDPEQEIPGALQDNCADYTMAVLPRGVSPDLGADGHPLRQGSRRAGKEAWFWGVARRSRHPEAALDLALHITSQEVHASEVARFFILPIRKDVSLPGTRFGRRVAKAAALQLAEGAEVVAPRPSTAAELRRFRDRMIDAWDGIVVRRGYRTADGRVSRERIRHLLRSYLEM